MTVRDSVLAIVLVTAFSITGCGDKEPAVKPQVGIQYDKPEDTEDISTEAIEVETETQEHKAVKHGISGNGLAGLEELQTSTEELTAEKPSDEIITSIPDYLANYISWYYTDKGLSLDKYKVIYNDKMIITKAHDKENYLLFSLSNYEDTGKAVVNISEIAKGKLYMYKDYLISVKNKLVKGNIYLGEGTPKVRAEDIGAKSVLASGEKVDFK